MNYLLILFYKYEIIQKNLFNILDIIKIFGTCSEPEQLFSLLKLRVYSAAVQGD